MFASKSGCFATWMRHVPRFEHRDDNLCAHIYGSYGTVAHMKTTVELPDSLMREAKRVALRERTTVRALIERGLRTVLSGKRPSARFVLRKAGFRGDGLVAGRSLRDWETIRDLTYSEQRYGARAESPERFVSGERLFRRRRGDRGKT
jgi:hypothetical protein